jgi:polyisoprenoid-binding protein YceI
MKKLILSIATVAFLASCNSETKPNQPSTKLPKKDSIAKEVTQPKKPLSCKKGYDKKSTKIYFGGFKTTEKKEVLGYFNKFNVDSTKIADTPEEIFENATIEIPINSLDTKDVGRNGRIKKHYFRNMKNTRYLKGKIVEFKKDSNKVNLELTMNEISKVVSLNYKVVGDTLSFNGEINALDFDASKSIKALNKACEALHKGADGISKTWAEVNLYLTTVVQKACE